MLFRRSLLAVSVVSIAIIVTLSCFAGVGVRAASGVINDFESPLTVTKLKGNPGASTVIIGWICPTVQCQWSQWVQNSGLKALNVEIFEGQASQGALVFSAYIVFADYGAYPSGIVQLPNFQPSYSHLYNIVLTPIGHKDTQALYFHSAEGKYLPHPQCTITQVGWNTYQFDASQSTDPDGYIVTYEWTWGGGMTSTGPIVVQSFSGFSASWSLTVTDNDGLQSGMFGTIPIGGIW